MVIAPCTFLLFASECPFGADCRAFHPSTNNLRQTRDTVRLHRKQRHQEQRISNAVKLERCIPKFRETTVFAKWIIEKFPRVRNVVDIAGGNGLLGLLLERLQPGLTAILVDPNLRTISRELHKWLGSQPLNRHVQTPFDEDGAMASNSELIEILGKPDTILVGFHPDQATDAIVNVGLEKRIPWVVVPCCVFPRLFPHRVWPGIKEGPVDTTDKLIDWIKAKNAGICEARLDFEGRNRVLFNLI